MSNNFSRIVEGVKALSTREKQELRQLLEKYLIEERRKEIYNSFVQSKKELDERRVCFSDDLGALKRMLARCQ